MVVTQQIPRLLGCLTLPLTVAAVLAAFDPWDGETWGWGTVSVAAAVASLVAAVSRIAVGLLGDVAEVDRCFRGVAECGAASFVVCASVCGFDVELIIRVAVFC